MLFITSMWLPLALAAPEEGEVQLPLTLLDAPYNFEGSNAHLSFEQSLNVAYAIDRLAIFGVQEAFTALIPENYGLRKGVGLGVTGALSVPLIFVGGWMHEEWHRAVMGSQGIDSHNGIYDPSLWSQGLVPVDQIADEDLARLKAETPEYTVRLMEAGMEAEHTLTTRISEEVFLYGGEGLTFGPFWSADSWTAPLLMSTELSRFYYYNLCTDPELDDTIDRENQRLAEVLDRDFTGPDCTAWVYDMFRPDEPYADRGEHPYGEGVDRYRSPEDLSDEEFAYLERVKFLHLLSFVNPHMAGLNGIILGGDPADRWIASLGFQPTVWGYNIDLHGGLVLGEFHGLTTLHAGFSELGLMPGVDLAWRDISLGDLPLAADLEIGAWLQPEGLRYDATARQLGGRLEAAASWRVLQRLDLRAGIEAKTAGWVMGNVYLEPNVSGRMGAVVHLR